MKWFRGVLNYFDIANNIGELLTRISLKLYYRSKHSALRKVGNVYKYGQGRQENIIDIFTLRKATRTSFKEYIVASQWLKKRELLEYKDSAKAFNGSNQYLWSLWTIQRGKDAVTKENLNPYDVEIHHIKPISKGGSNNLENLILVSSKTHDLIHHGIVKHFFKKFFQSFESGFHHMLFSRNIIVVSAALYLAQTADAHICSLCQFFLGHISHQVNLLPRVLKIFSQVCKSV